MAVKCLARYMSRDHRHESHHCQRVEDSIASRHHIQVSVITLSSPSRSQDFWNTSQLARLIFDTDNNVSHIHNLRPRLCDAAYFLDWPVRPPGNRTWCSKYTAVIDMLISKLQDLCSLPSSIPLLNGCTLAEAQIGGIKYEEGITGHECPGPICEVGEAAKECG